MTESTNQATVTSEHVFQAIQDSWCAETCGSPTDWSPDNPSWQQCDASAFVAWEHLGGELVLGKVSLDGVDTEHHYWNRINGVDIDLTRRQFSKGESIRELQALAEDEVRQKAKDIKPEVSSRIAALSDRVKLALTAQVRMESRTSQ